MCILVKCRKSAFKNVAYFNSNDLEYILEQGDALYKTIGSHDFLSCPDLPREFMIENVPVTVEFINNASFFGFLHSGSNCLSELITNLSANFRNSIVMYFPKGIFATNGVSVNEITVVSLNLTFRIMLVYKKHGQLLHSLKELMVYVMRVWAPDVILGNFNINLLASENQHFVEFMTNNNYTQIVCEPTHINGSLLDHVYIAPTMNSRLRC